MLNTIRIQNQRLALEAFAGANVAQLLSDTFPSVVAGVKSFFNIFTADTPAIAFTFNEYNVVRDIRTHTYTDLMPLAAFVPEGLDVTFIKYSVPLLKSAEHISLFVQKVLPTYTTFLGQLINNHDSQLSTVSFSKAFMELTAKREVLNDELGKCFKLGSSKSEVTYGNVINRNNDWESLLKVSAEIAKIVNTIDRRALNKMIHECTSMLETILDKIKRNEFQQMSPEVINNLSEGTYQMARELEFYSVIYFKVQVFINSINKTIDHFKSVVK